MSKRSIQTATAGRSVETLEARVLLSFTAHVNFQPDSMPAPCGYVVDSGNVYGNRGNGYCYGWNALTPDVYARYSPFPVPGQFSTLAEMQMPSNPKASWQIAVPNGLYQVHVVAGDPLGINSVYKLNVNGVAAINGVPNANYRWLEGTVNLNVCGGSITLSSGIGALNNKVDFIDIVSAQPDQFTAKATGSNRIDLSWCEPATCISGFCLERATDGGCYTPIAMLPANATCYSDCGVLDGKTYQYRITAVAGALGSAPALACATTPLAAPCGLQAFVDPHGTRVGLCWSNNSATACGLLVQRATDGGDWQTLAVLPPFASGYIDPSVCPGGTYSYHVVAFNAQGQSAPSNCVTVHILAIPSHSLVQTDLATIDLTTLGLSGTQVFSGSNPILANPALTLQQMLLGTP